jgi:hypothetical protein
MRPCVPVTAPRMTVVQASLAMFHRRFLVVCCCCF